MIAVEGTWGGRSGSDRGSVLEPDLQLSSGRTSSGGEEGMSCQRGADCKRKVGHKVRLENVAAATRFHRGFHKSMVFKAREEHDFRRRADFLEAASRLKTVHYRHHNVEDENVRL